MYQFSRCTERIDLPVYYQKTALEAINASLLAPLAQRLHHSIDILLFNPPYVPTFCEEAAEAQEKKDIAGAWAGGKDGMELTWPILLALDVSPPTAWNMNATMLMILGGPLGEGGILSCCSQAERRSRSSMADERRICV